MVSVVYLDDWLCIGENRQKCLENGHLTISLLESVGFVINYFKSKLDPEVCCKYLGVIINSRNSTFTLTDKKKEKIVNKLEKMSLRAECRIIEVAKLIGMLIAACIAVDYGWLYTRKLEKEKLQALESSHGSYSGRMRLGPAALEEIKWWKENFINANRFFKERKIDRVIYTDASDTGWGATDAVRRVFGFWNRQEFGFHINYKELLAVKLALLKLGSKLVGQCILLRIDNSTAIAYINRMGGVRYEHYHALAKDIWHWAECRGNLLKATYIPSKENLIADRLSRIRNPDAEWELSSEAFRSTVVELGRPEVDLFATKGNKKCTRYVTRFPDSSAWQIDAFSFSWRGIFFYAFPPFNVIGKTLAKIREDGAQGILIVPRWENQYWYPLFLKLRTERFIDFKHNPSILISMCREKRHPRAKYLVIIAAIVSGERLQKKMIPEKSLNIMLSLLSSSTQKH